MAETPDGPPAEPKRPKAVKDKECPYCHQAFTSSSLGRHLDLYIREKNPKPPDGVHDVEAIRKLRQNITRRQPKGSASRRDASARTPTVASRKRSPVSGDAESSTLGTPPSHGDGSRAPGASARSYPFNMPWEATGVINDLAVPDAGADRHGPSRGPRQTTSPHSASRQRLKQQMDLRQQIQDARDTSRAAELALRELLSSLRAAKYASPPLHRFPQLHGANSGQQTTSQYRLYAARF